MEHITYRLAVTADCPALAQLKGEVWRTTYRGIYSDKALDNYDVARNQRIFEEIVANPEIELYVAEHGGKPVGLMTCGKPFRPFMHYQWEIGLLYILKDHQRQGIGSGFFELARDQVRKQGGREILVSVNRLNHNAIRFYTAMGGHVVHEDEKQLKFCCPC